MSSPVVVILEGGPGAGKTVVAKGLARELERLGFKVCIVGDAIRFIAPVLAKIYGKWHLAPREIVEYMFLGYQLARLRECSLEGYDIILVDYGIEAALAYMEADGVDYPKQLNGLAEAALHTAKVLVLVLEKPVAYNVDGVRWEDPITSQRYSRPLVQKALSLVGRVGALAYVIPEKRSVEERVRVASRIVASHVTMGREAPGPLSPVTRGSRRGPEQAPRG